MKKFSDIKTQNLGHMTAIVLLSATLAACGGSSGGSAGGDTDTQDLFGSTDPTLDTDLDGVTDVIEETLGTDPLVPDSDLDSDGDGVSNIDEIIGGTDPGIADSIVIDNPDPTDGGDTTGSDCDRNSDTAEWGDNCTVRNGGSFATSSYAKGIQRILWCQGYDGGQGDINSFADGIFGPNTEQATRDFQADNGLAVDGVVGEDTWPVLFSKLSLLRSDADYDVHYIDGVNCSTLDPQFYQLANGALLEGWKMAEFPGSTVLVDFGVAP